LVIIDNLGLRQPDTDTPSRWRPDIPHGCCHYLRGFGEWSGHAAAEKIHPVPQSYIN
jgi:hypothetical protein